MSDAERDDGFRPAMMNEPPVIYGDGMFFRCDVCRGDLFIVLLTLRLLPASTRDMMCQTCGADYRLRVALEVKYEAG